MYKLLTWLMRLWQFGVKWSLAVELITAVPIARGAAYSSAEPQVPRQVLRWSLPIRVVAPACKRATADKSAWALGDAGWSRRVSLSADP